MGRRDTCVFRMRRSAEERFRPSSCSMLCSMAAGGDGVRPSSTADLPRGEGSHSLPAWLPHQDGHRRGGQPRWATQG